MTRKDYVLIAKAFKDELDNTDVVQILAKSVLQRAAYRMASMLQADNPRFDRERFMTACGF